MIGIMRKITFDNIPTETIQKQQPKKEINKLAVLVSLVLISIAVCIIFVGSNESNNYEWINEISDTTSEDPVDEYNDTTSEDTVDEYNDTSDDFSFIGTWNYCIYETLREYPFYTWTFKENGTFIYFGIDEGRYEITEDKIIILYIDDIDESDTIHYYYTIVDNDTILLEIGEIEAKLYRME